VLAAAALAALGSAVPASAATTVRASSFGTVYERLKYGPKYYEYLDVFESPRPHSPVVVLVHGGGWRYLDALVRFESESLALQAQGFTVINVQYNQDSPTMPAFPLEPEEITLATRWAIANAAAYNGEPGDVTLLGGSAGGHLVSVVAQNMNAQAPGTIRGVVALSPPTDLVALTQMIEAETITNEDFITSDRQAVAREQTGQPYMYTVPWEQEAFEQRWSPVDNATPSCPRWAIFNSEEELIPLSQAQELQSSLTKSGCQATLRVVPGTRHAFGYWRTVAPQVIEFIKSL
jgi:acetyl esterase/lipase